MTRCNLGFALAVTAAASPRLDPTTAFAPIPRLTSIVPTTLAVGGAVGRGRTGLSPPERFAALGPGIAEAPAAPTQGAEAVSPWNWRGHNIYHEVTPAAAPTSSAAFPSWTNILGGVGGRGPREKPAVLLIHGFGASTVYWRSTTEALSTAGYDVHSLDLLGQGRSAKPGDVYYSTELWAEMVDDYAREFVGEEGGNKGVVLMGNSLGSVVALAAATGESVGAGGSGFLSEPGRVRGLCLYNCGIGMNSKNIINDPRFGPIQQTLLRTLFSILETLLFNRLVLGYALGNIVTPDLLRKALISLYKNDPGRVDDELVESFYRPAKDIGAAEALRQIYTNDAGPTPMELHKRHGEVLGARVPIQLVWGDEDVVTPLDEVVGKFYQGLAADPGRKVDLEVVRAGHVPFDDNPEDSNGVMLRWLEATVIR